MFGRRSDLFDDGEPGAFGVDGDPHTVAALEATDSARPCFHGAHETERVQQAKGAVVVIDADDPSLEMRLVDDLRRRQPRRIIERMIRGVGWNNGWNGEEQRGKEND